MTTPEQIKKAINTFEQRIEEHEKKLQLYMDNPDLFDNKGFHGYQITQNTGNDPYSCFTAMAE